MRAPVLLLLVFATQGCASEGIAYDDAELYLGTGIEQLKWFAEECDSGTAHDFVVSISLALCDQPVYAYSLNLPTTGGDDLILENAPVQMPACTGL